MEVAEIYSGRKFVIYAITLHNRCPVEEFINALSETEQKKVVKLLQFSADYGLPVNEEKFKKLEKDIWEFKSNKARILCFFEKEKIIITTHGFLKKTGKTPRGEIKKAKKIRDSYLSQR